MNRRADQIISASDGERTEIPIEQEQMSQIRELQLENSRLRRLITDLLLEKVSLRNVSAGAILESVRRL